MWRGSPIRISMYGKSKSLTCKHGDSLISIHWILNSYDISFNSILLYLYKGYHIWKKNANEKPKFYGKMRKVMI